MQDTGGIMLFYTGHKFTNNIRKVIKKEKMEHGFSLT